MVRLISRVRCSAACNACCAAVSFASVCSGSGWPARTAARWPGGFPASSPAQLEFGRAPVWLARPLLSPSDLRLQVSLLPIDLGLQLPLLSFEAGLFRRKPFPTRGE